MYRIMNGMSRGLRLQGHRLKVKLAPIGHPGSTADISQEVVDDLRSNSVVRKYEEGKYFYITEKPLQREVPIKTSTSEREIPEHLRPKEENAATGGKVRPEGSDIQAKVEDIHPPKKGKIQASKAKSAVEAIEPVKKAK